MEWDFAFFLMPNAVGSVIERRVQAVVFIVTVLVEQLDKLERSIYVRILQIITRRSAIWLKSG